VYHNEVEEAEEEYECDGNSEDVEYQYLYVTDPAIAS